MKKLLFIITSAGISFSDSAQDAKSINVHLDGLPQCGFGKVLQKANVQYADLVSSYKNTAKAVNNPLARTEDVLYDIPVVFHIVYASSQPTFNLPDSVIANQVDILNKAFRKQNADTGNVRSYFKGLSVDAHIQFHLATTDPQGNPTTGITRTVSTRAYFNNNNNIDSLERLKHTSEGGIDAWPTDHYLNIWVGNLSDSAGQLSILGYGIPPTDPIPSNWPSGDAAGLATLGDGVVVQTHLVGSNSSLNAALNGIYTRGRGTVHEVGHYLGLQHVFGGNDGSSTTGSCGAIADDGIDDTPEQSTMSFDSNSGVSCPPDTKNSCGAGTPGDLPDMWENYMDYARDACQVLFTADQVNVMRGVLANQRNSLVSPVTAVPVVSVKPTFSVYPNPATDKVSIFFAGDISRLTVYNFMGRQMVCLTGQDANAKIYNIDNFPAGQYLIVAENNGNVATAKFSVVH